MIIGRLIGGKLVHAHLGILQAKIPKKADEAVEITAERIAGYARDFVAVDTGKTLESIRVERHGSSWWVVADRGGDHPGVPAMLELGTRHMEARPFFRPAIELVIGTSSAATDIRTIGGLLG